VKYSSFKELPIWKEAILLSSIICEITTRRDWKEHFELKKQMRRAAISISSNIVEGFENEHTSKFINYLLISKGSIGEIRNQLIIAEGLGLIRKELLKTVETRLTNLSGDITKFIMYLRKYKEGKSRKQ